MEHRSEGAKKGNIFSEQISMPCGQEMGGRINLFFAYFVPSWFKFSVYFLLKLGTGGGAERSYSNVAVDQTERLVTAYLFLHRHSGVRPAHFLLPSVRLLRPGVHPSCGEIQS
jgi:hypothetical protein